MHNQKFETRPDNNSISPSTSNVDNDFNLPIAIRKGTRQCTQHPLSLFVSFDNFSQSHKSSHSFIHITISQNPNRALNNEKWRQAMRVEIETLKKNRTRVMVELLKGKKPVGCKWVYLVKYKVDGSL